MNLVMQDGFVWQWIGTRLHTMKSGRRVSLIMWRGDCVECGASFVIATRAKRLVNSDTGLRRCKAHRLSQREISKRLRTRNK